MTDVIKDFCGVLTEEAIRRNFILIYEVIDEMFDFGYPQLTSTDQVKDFIVSPPELPQNIKISGTSFFNKSTIKVDATNNPITNYKDRNEIFVDVIEKISVLFNSSMNVINSSVDGSLKMKSYLTGSPTLQLTFNNDTRFDDYNFHECVDDSDFSYNKKLVIKPPAGEFVTMNYRMTRDFNFPFKISSFINEESKYKIQLLIKVKCELPKENSAKLVSVIFSTPENASSVKPSIPENRKNEKVSHDESEKQVQWEIESFKGQTELTLSTNISLAKEVSMYHLRKEIGPIKMQFEISQMNTSPLKIKSLIIENTEKENPSKWVRYITTSDCYVARL